MQRILSILAFLTLTVGVHSTCLAQVQAQTGTERVPMDPKVRMGKLANGLTYYIRPGVFPPGQACFYIVQRVGSLQEEADQRGLAHFLEHMCFNGTEHFPGTTAMRGFLQRHGLNGQFNADTDMEETTYHVDNVPTTQGTELLDSMLLVLRDWAHGLALTDQAVDKERNVIVEEWRSRNIGRQRLIYNAISEMYAGSKYANCLPIGDMNIIRTFKPKRLIEYYDRWYNPENQAIVVTGDFDVDHMERAIRETFASLRRTAGAADYSDTDLPGNKQPIIVVQQDKELGEEELFIYRKMPKVSNDERGTVAYRRRRVIEILVDHMIDERARLAGLKPESPYTEVGTAFGNYLTSIKHPGLMLRFSSKEGKMQECLEYGMTLLRQAAEHGFGNTECQRASQWMHERMQQTLEISNRYGNQYMAQKLANSYLTGEPVMEDTTCVLLYEQILSTLTLDDLNMYAKEHLYKQDNSNLAIMTLNKDDGKHLIPNKKELGQILQRVAKTPTAPYEDMACNKPLMAELPTPGEIVSLEPWNYGFNKVTLKNGMRVFLAYCEKEPGKVVMKAWSPGGINSKEGGTPLMASFSGSAFYRSRKGGLSYEEQQNMLMGKNIDMNWEADQCQTTFWGECVASELETMLQMFHLTMTSMEPDEKAFEAKKREAVEMLSARDGTPDAIFQDSINNCWFDKSSSRWVKVPTGEEVRSFDYRSAYKIYKELTSDAGAFDVVIMGQVDTTQMKRLVETYLASLPGSGKDAYERNIRSINLERNVKSKTHKVDFAIPMQIPQSYLHNAWVARGVDYTLENVVKTQLVCGMLEKMLNKKVREEMGAAYTPQTSLANIPSEQGQFILGVQSSFPVKPETTDAVVKAVNELMQEIATNPNAELLQNTQGELENMYNSQVIYITSFVSWVEMKEKYGHDYVADFTNLVRAQTLDSIREYARKLLKDGTHFSVTMRPQ